MMKVYIPLSLVCISVITNAQSIISVATGTTLSIHSGTEFSAGGLSLTPSAPFSLSDNALLIQPTVTHFTANNYVSRVYKFSSTTASFSGTIKFSYTDAELNGLAETALQVNIHDGVSWHPTSTASFDVSNNLVVTNAVTMTSLSELALADRLVTLPLQWGAVAVRRNASHIIIYWETWQEGSVSNFTIESSRDGRTWTGQGSNIAARNRSGKEVYETTLATTDTENRFFRIKQIDYDGRWSYSPIAKLHTGHPTNLLVYPNPVQKELSINATSLDGVAAVQLYNNTGMLVKSWLTLQLSYSVEELSSGLYHLQIVFKNGTTRRFKINKL